MAVEYTYDYAIVRIVPRVERGERINVGIILSCPDLDFLDARIELDEARLLALDPTVDLDLIRANLHRAPMYSGQIKSSGPRYCPSIEDKVVRFADKERHQLFLEPEGRNTLEVYVNGISTSLPRDVQDGLFRLIPGLENAQIMRYGYAVEYDYAPPDPGLLRLQDDLVALGVVPAPGSAVTGGGRRGPGSGRPPQEVLLTWLDGYRVRGSFDDRTLVVLHRGGGHAR